MVKRLFLLVIVLSIIIIGCGKSSEFSPGKIYDSVFCVKNSSQYYALYLPKSYTGYQKYPIVFFFDPGARGKLPVEKYKILADSLQVILAGSYNSKNGSIEVSTAAANFMIADVKERIRNIDNSAVFLSGFSGGSRFAYYYALNHPEIKGVIGCGASLPGFAKNVFPPVFNYTLIAGFSDFNFREMYQVKEIFRQNQEAICFIPFEGKHEWPDSIAFYKAMLYQLSVSLPNSASDNMVKFMSEQRKSLDQFRNTRNLLALKWGMENMFEIEYAVSESSSYLDSLNHLSTSVTFILNSQLFQKSLRFEDSLNQEITQASSLMARLLQDPLTSDNPMNWWEKEINKFSTFENDSNIYLSQVGKRLKSQVCIQQWEINRKLAGAGNYDKSLKSARILCLANPDEPIYNALVAESLEAKGKTKDALEELKIAVAKGYKFDEPSLKANIYLTRLKNNL